MRDNRLFIQGLDEMGIHLSDSQQKQFEDYYDILVEWNSVMNLTGITEYNEVLVKHFLDSLVLEKVYKPVGNLRLLDMGTGAGFPGIPLKIVYPKVEVLLVDSLNKRVKFLNEVIAKLGLDGIHAIHGRAEELSRKKEYRESFDICVSRAVARMSSLSEFCIPFVKKDGYFIPYKSGKIKEEVEEAKYAIKVLGGKVIDTVSFYLPDTDVERSLVVVRKLKTTPGVYPRGGGKVLKSPISCN